MTLRQCVWLLCALVACGAGVSCTDSKSSKTPAAGVVQLQGAGATFPAPLYKKWLEEYQKLHPEVQLSYDAVGSGEGTKRFLGNGVDFGASDAALSDEEMAAVARGAQLVPVVAGQYRPGL